MGSARHIYRNDGGPGLLAMHPGAESFGADDLSCFMPDVMFHDQPAHATVPSMPMPSGGYGPILASQIIGIGDVNDTELHHISRKRPLPPATIQHEFEGPMGLMSGGQEQMPIKRSMSVAPSLPSIKPEPDALSPFCGSALMEPASPANVASISISAADSAKAITPLIVDTCSNISSCSTSPSASQAAADSNGHAQKAQQHQSSNSEGNDSCPMQCIRFSPFQQQSWHVLCDQSLKEL